MKPIANPGQRPAHGVWRRWLAFALWAVVIVAATPVANDVQKWIKGQFGAKSLRYALIALVLTLTASLVIWLVRKRLSAPYHRLLWLLGIATVALALMWRLEVEAEPAHLAAYGVLGVLAFRALSSRLRDTAVYPAAAALTALVGTFDEVVQWLLPKRFWGLGDVGLNVTAAVLVQLLIWKVVRPPGIAPGASPRSLRVALRLVACEVALLALCLANTPVRVEWYASRLPGFAYLGKDVATRMTEYGHLYDDPESGRFRSRLAPEELRAADRRRAAEAARILETLGRTSTYGQFQRAYRPSRDPFVFEAGGHLHYRERLSQRARQAADPAEKRRLGTVAFRENLILERYYPHTLANSSLALAPADRQWLGELDVPAAGFESEVSNWMITRFSEAQARWGLLIVLFGLILADRVLARRSPG